MRLLEAVNLQVEEAALTGESLPVQKNAALQLERISRSETARTPPSWAPPSPTGVGSGVVTGTGMRTQLGLIANMLQAVDEEETPLQRRLDQLGQDPRLGCAGDLWIGLHCGSFQEYRPRRLVHRLRGRYLAYLNAQRNQIVEMFMMAVSLAIAAVPEGLPAVVTISLALGMAR